MQQQRFSLSDAWDLFYLDCQAQRFTRTTLEFYRSRLAQFIAWCSGQRITQLDELTAAHIRRYLVELQERDLSSHYIHSHARTIKTFCNYAVRDGLIVTSPFSSVQMPKLEQKTLPALSADDVQAVVGACETTRDRAIVLLLVDSGMRASELVKLNVGDVDLRTGQIDIRLGKGRKSRPGFIGAATRKQLRLYLIERGNPGDGEPLLISERGGNRFTYYGVAQLLQRLRVAAGVPRLTAHALRRTYAITMLRNGCDIHTLAKLMGHADISVLRHYLDITEDDLRTAHDEHGPVDNM